MSLNKAQKEAIAHFKGPCMVLAGPGSGKTLTIAKRIEYLIKMYKVRPEEILVITFTKYAANEMKERFRTIMGSDGYPVNFGTFHSVYYRILRWAYGLREAGILSEGEKYALLRRIIQSGTQTILYDDEEDDYFRGLIEEIAKMKNNRMEVSSYVSVRYGKEKFREIYRKYEEEKKQIGKIDFEDMLLLCFRLFTERKDILEKWQKKFRYVLIDEFQDINQVQYDVIRMLAEPENNIFAVGDDDQSIYAFRGAKPGIMLKFEKDYPSAKRVILDVNYRSSAHIVNGALRVIEYNKKRYKKTIHSWKSADKNVHVQELKDPLEESKYILRRIQEATKEGIPPEEISVLFRTVMDVRILTEALAEYQIPFQMRERIQNIYDHFTAQDMISYLKIVRGDFERKDFLRIANRPNRYISRDSMSEEEITYDSLRNFYLNKQWMIDRIDQLEWDIMMLQGKTPYTAIEYIRKSVGYDEFLEEYAADRGLSYADLCERLDRVQESSKEYADIEEWFLHIENYKDMLRKTEEKYVNGKGIHLHTIHGAKGLEYDTVFILGANEGIMPYKKAKLSEETEEERRLFYVAMTRAKRQLIITYTKERNGKNMSVSRFIYELTGSQKDKNDVK